MDYRNSICFSAKSAEMLNSRAFQLDCRLFVFAYYEPKKYRETESKRSQFITAIVNLYSLFKDCVPLMPGLLSTEDSILVMSNWKDIRNDFFQLFHTVTSFRSIFCHNSSLYYPLNEENLQHVEDWISNCIPNAPGIEDISENQWALLLQELDIKANGFIREISNNLNCLIDSTEISRKNRVITHWIKVISSCYLVNPNFLLNAFAGMYQLYLHTSGGRYDSNKKLKQQTLDWLHIYCGVPKQSWFAKWLDKDKEEVVSSKIYIIINDWRNQWAQWNGRDPEDCDEAPLPEGKLFKILAQDMYNFAIQPDLGYH